MILDEASYCGPVCPVRTVRCFYRPRGANISWSAPVVTDIRESDNRNFQQTPITTQIRRNGRQNRSTLSYAVTCQKNTEKFTLQECKVKQSPQSTKQNIKHNAPKHPVRIDKYLTLTSGRSHVENIFTCIANFIGDIGCHFSLKK